MLFGSPIRKSKASGAIQLEDLSTKSITDKPEIGLERAVIKAQIIAHITIILIGKNKTNNATIISKTPIYGNVHCAKLSVNPKPVIKEIHP